MLNKPKQGKSFRDLRVELTNVEVDYDNEVESNNTSDVIARVLSEEVHELNKIRNII